MPETFIHNLVFQNVCPPLNKYGVEGSNYVENVNFREGIESELNGHRVIMMEYYGSKGLVK